MPQGGSASPPDLIGRLDFSIFHPQDHWAFVPHCRTLPGGGRRHLRDWWDYRFEQRPDLVCSRLACRLLGRHDYRESWHSHKATPAQRAGLEHRPLFYNGRVCWWCGAQDPDSPAEFCSEHQADRKERG